MSEERKSRIHYINKIDTFSYTANSKFYLKPTVYGSVKFSSVTCSALKLVLNDVTSHLECGVTNRKFSICCHIFNVFVVIIELRTKQNTTA